jgi:hypothetical protein
MYTKFKQLLQATVVPISNWYGAKHPAQECELLNLEEGISKTTFKGQQYLEHGTLSTNFCLQE